MAGTKGMANNISTEAETIHSTAFMGMGLTSATIPNNIKTIDILAFYDNKLTSVFIPNSVETIIADAFIYNNITEVKIDNSEDNITIAPTAFDFNGANNKESIEPIFLR